MLRPSPGWHAVFVVALCFPAAANAQAPPAQDQNSAEVTTHDTPATFRTKVNLVLVPVVVRDKSGRAIGNLHKEDFQISDRGKPQIISSFSIETLANPSPEPVKTLPAENGVEAPASAAQAVMPNRFVAYVFDDVHISLSDLMQVRAAAQRHLTGSLVPTDRAAIFTTSGRTTLDFTDDRAKLLETLLRLNPQPIARSPVQECPDISYYQADLIVNKNDPLALNAAVQDTFACMRLDPTDASSRTLAQTVSTGQAQHVLQTGEVETQAALTVLNQVVRRLSTMPGKRSIILASPGFITLADLFSEKSALIDHAIRANVIISTLNARGLYTVIPGGDASQPNPESAAGAMIRAQYETNSSTVGEDVLAELAYGTGGVFFHNDNDLFEGFNRVAARPDFIYVLGFSPENLKLDGRFHALKITVRNSGKLDLQARRGYYAPQHLADPGETAKEEIRDALFSREELRDIPVEIHTQFFKSSVENAKLAVLARVDVKHLRFRKENGRNMDNLTVVSGVFDRNGNLITGNQKTVEMHLKDQTLESRLDHGITVRSSFDVKPGSYLVRLVVRDSEGELMAAANGAVEIPMN